MANDAVGARVEIVAAGETTSETCCVLLPVESGPTIVALIVTFAPFPVVDAGGV